MATDLSVLTLPALVEHMQASLAELRQRLTAQGSLSPGDRSAAAKHVKVLAATLGNLKRTLRREQVAEHVSL